MVQYKRSETVEEEIAGLGDLSRADFVGRWVALYRSPPPKGISRALLIRAIAYRIQTSKWGGLKSATLRQLQKAAGEPVSEAKTLASPSRWSLRPGTRLLREWNGKTHQVEVVETGFIWDDRPYKPLSAIAREITGARWSGPRFFGLTEKRLS